MEEGVIMAESLNQTIQIRNKAQMLDDKDN